MEEMRSEMGAMIVASWGRWTLRCGVARAKSSLSLLGCTMGDACSPIGRVVAGWNAARRESAYTNLRDLVGVGGCRCVSLSQSCELNSLVQTSGR